MPYYNLMSVLKCISILNGDNKGGQSLILVMLSQLIPGVCGRCAETFVKSGA
uniref:Uncharacterized protein n=1 Tax=Anguilla anguilla TaxID=7936 RepID=A0A0E9SN72_ANGAN